MRQTLLTVGVVVLCVCAMSAQGPAAAQNPIAAGQKMLHSMVKNNIVRSAEKMPEENYPFKPTPEVRSFGQLIGHVADSQYRVLLGRARQAQSRAWHREVQDDEGGTGAGREGRVRLLRPGV